MFLDHLTDKEFIARLYASELTHVENALLFRLERAIDGKHDDAARGQFGAHTSDPFPGAFNGKK